MFAGGLPPAATQACWVTVDPLWQAWWLTIWALSGGLPALHQVWVERLPLASQVLIRRARLAEAAAVSFARPAHHYAGLIGRVRVAGIQARPFSVTVALLTQLR